MTKEQDKKLQQDFKDFCEKNRLRWKIDDDRLPIAHTRSTKYVKDHMFEGFLNGDFGVYIERASNRGLNNAIKELVKMGCRTRQLAHLEATLTINPDKAIPVATFLKIVKKTASNTHPTWGLK